MDEKDFIKVLQLYRHDLINHLQVIQGYVNMDQLDKVKSKVNDLWNHLNQEKILVHTDAPKFIFWILQVNHVEENIRIKYHFIDKIKLGLIDELLTEQCKQLVEQIKNNGENFKLYEVNISFLKNKSSQIVVNFNIQGEIKLELMMSNLSQLELNHYLDIKQTSNGLDCNLTYSLI